MLTSADSSVTCLPGNLEGASLATGPFCLQRKNEVVSELATTAFLQFPESLISEERGTLQLPYPYIYTSVTIIRDIDILPDEILLLIFVKGCEDALDEGPPSCFRNLKDFTRSAHRVNKRWQTLINHPLNKSFWIARLFLELPHSQLQGQPFAKQITTFRRQLLNLTWLDLVVSLSQGYLPRIVRIQFVILNDAICHGFCISISQTSNKGVFARQPLALLFPPYGNHHPWMDGNAPPFRGFFQPVLMERPLVSIFNFKSLLDNPIQRPILPRKPTVASTLATLTHIRNLYTITLPNFSRFMSPLRKKNGGQNSISYDVPNLSS